MSQLSRHFNVASCFAGLLALTTLAGCGEAGPALGLVTGTVKNASGPVAGATVEFHPETGRPSYGTTQTDGSYMLTYTEDSEGAILGSHKVRVTLSSEVAATDGSEEVMVVEPKTFSVPTPATVNEGENTVDIDLSTAQPI